MKLASARGTRTRISRATNGFRMQLMMMGLYTPSPGTPVRNCLGFNNCFGVGR